MLISPLRFIFTSLLFAFAGSTLLAQDAEWTSLFDGKTMDGWEKVGN